MSKKKKNMVPGFGSYDSGAPGFVEMAGLFG